MDATDFLTERPICPGQLSRGQCDSFLHLEAWQTLLRHMHRFPNDIDDHKSLAMCAVCECNIRDPKNHPTPDDWVKREKEFEEYERQVRAWQKMTQKAKNNREMGPRELTLTYSPAWFQDDDEAKDAFRQAEEKLLRYYKNELLEYRSVGEYTKDRRAHLHIMYHLTNGGKFTDKNINRAYKYWNAKIKVGKGNQGGHHALVKSVSDYSGYLEKDLHDNWHYYNHNNAVQESISSSSPSGSSPPEDVSSSNDEEC